MLGFGRCEPVCPVLGKMSSSRHQNRFSNPIIRRRSLLGLDSSSGFLFRPWAQTCNRAMPVASRYGLPSWNIFKPMSCLCFLVRNRILPPFLMNRGGRYHIVYRACISHCSFPIEEHASLQASSESKRDCSQFGSPREVSPLQRDFPVLSGWYPPLMAYFAHWSDGHSPLYQVLPTSNSHEQTAYLLEWATR